MQGGVILGFEIHHTTCDIRGMGTFLSLLTKACRDEPFAEYDIRIGSRRLDSPIQLLEGEIKVKCNHRFEMQVTPEPDENNAAPAHLPSQKACRLEYFSFSASSLAELKAKATKEIRKGGGNLCPWMML